ncbi:RHS repeat-associated protein [Streptomyces sp. DvalAA-21]|nr:RHS repeat-associated protein [Streptomyces sp. DvalAA-21]RAJ40685.1 RHS repeat-associated protein [Streptomyces sp. DpondAA-E10]RAJ45860.1 RHS repeat-associated protein [Streptomyces sp. DpondAA-A50]SCE13265.1 RHS repeat-associated core domain-containing protein [Streptomyces sp. DpondAA-F4a]SCL88994.1 RHS repeat-associated core domain-containing protein [Streptomyces sp. DpondAA-F4]
MKEPTGDRRAPRYKPTLVDPYRDHLRQRRAENPAVPVTHLLREIKELGYTGSANLLVRYLTQGRAEGNRPVTTPQRFARLLLTHQDTTATTCPTSPTYAYDDASQLISKSGSTTGWSYDTAGNETAATPAGGTAHTGESWSDYNQLTSITTSGTTYQAKHAGTTNDERTKLGDTWFHHTQLGLASTTTGPTDTGFVREPGGTLNSMTRSGKSYYYLTDATSSILGAVDQTGTRTHAYAYTPTGTPRTTPTETAPQPYRFAGAYSDPTGLYKMGARYYDPALGRFTQPDPSGQETNTYLYAEGDPINRTDPQGTLSFDSIGNSLGIGTILYAGFTGGTGAAESATASMIADVGITALCEVGAAAFTGPGAVPALPFCMAIGAAAGMYVGATYQNNLN